MRPKMLVAMLALAAPAFAQSDPDVALAHDFFSLHALRGGYASLEGEALDTASRNLVTYCAKTPAAQMPREKLQLCEEFDDYKRANERWDRFRALRDR